MADDGLTDVKAPISGTFYRASSPDAPPFVEVGTAVRKGQTLGLLEAMKLFSKIKAPHDGVVRAIDTADAEQVKVGQLLFRLSR